MITIVTLTLLLSFIAGTSSFGGHDHGEFGHTCTVCNCFIKYENRDIKIPVEPYGEVIYPTLDQCLTLCWYDRQRCRSLIYGIVGGNAGIICELYNASGISDNLYYHWAIDYYEPALNWPCNATFYPPQDVQVQVPEPGRARFRKEFANRPNPNYGQNFVFAQYPQILAQQAELAYPPPPVYNGGALSYGQQPPSPPYGGGVQPPAPYSGGQAPSPAYGPPPQYGAPRPYGGGAGFQGVRRADAPVGQFGEAVPSDGTKR